MAEPLPLAPPYEPPRISRVLTPEDLAHEILYAGAQQIISLTDTDNLE
jgi:hypothetical protein